MSASYAYNPSGLRKAKTVGGSTKYFVYNGMNIVYEYSESVADGVTYFYGLNRTHNSEGEIYLYNAHGDVVQLVKDNAVVASYTYDAFGNLTSQIGESDNPFLYCGEYYDAETQTYYLRARYYNPANGRFTQQDAWSFMDTSDPLSLNLYAYCCNNPITYTDPSGHRTQQTQPPPASSGFVPKKGKTPENSWNKERGGWEDKNGNIWKPDRAGHGVDRESGDSDHWDVERKDGKGYVNVGKNGKKWGGKGKAPSLSNPQEADENKESPNTLSYESTYTTYTSSDVTHTMINIAGGVAAIYIVWQIVKWGAAAAAAPCTAGGSLALAALTP